MGLAPLGITSIVSFVSAYFSVLKKHFTQWLPRQQSIKKELYHCDLTMAESTHPMEIDGDDLTPSARHDKGKSVVVVAAGNPPFAGKAIPWVEKYRPQSLDDVAAHRDIVETGKTLSSPFPSLGFGLSYPRLPLVAHPPK